ncbi:disease resistance protein At4g27190-like [Durio zibethinus]|uniref:Disease resistance protein At4g27190-like n=1 Tax=Durio zibethinus TaxID=66656 RepID=A0A6P5ZLG2_DURZI|nr:disease resistance protein At4g27190-like [Durio zibethinus]
MARAPLQHEIEDAERQLQGIEDDVRDLLSKTDKILSDMETLENEIQQNMRCFNWCPNWSWRYRLSKKAMKNTFVIFVLLENTTKFGQPGRVGYRSPSTVPTIEFHSSKDFMDSKSSKTASNQIIEAHRMTICDYYVSQKPNFETIQDEIAKYLDFDVKNELGRRSRQEFWLKLQDEKRILIILHDVWAKIDLKEEIGIPFAEDHKGCKILLTTRRQQVCTAMGCQKTIPLGCLDDHEAWTLFAAIAGLDNSSDDAIKHVATKVIKKCEGLPIAIVALGSALKGKNHHMWKAAHRKLKNRRLGDIEDIDQQNAYLCLEVSFDYLKDTATKMCFLLYSLFPEDYKIYVEELVRYAWGLELYEGMGSIEEVRSEVLAAIDILKDSCLLINCGERHVKMHDMVSDVALWIAFYRKEFSFVIKSEVIEMWAKDESFEPCEAVSFKTSQIVELPKGLAGCKLLGISLLGKLKVLSFSRSDIKELQEEIGDLDNLKLLDLSYCKQLQRIPPQLIRRLSQSEELYLHGCERIKWATENTVQEESYASLSELNSLSNLAVLSLEVSSKHLPRDFLFRKLPRFCVCVSFSKLYVMKRDFEIDQLSGSLEIEGL